MALNNHMFALFQIIRDSLMELSIVITWKRKVYTVGKGRVSQVLQ